MLSIPHLIVIFIVAFIVLGPDKLPQVARALGKTMAEIRRITGDFRYQIEGEMREVEREARLQEAAIQTAMMQSPAVPAEHPEAAQAPAAAPAVEPSAVPEQPPAEDAPVATPVPAAGHSSGGPAEPSENPTDGESHAA